MASLHFIIITCPEAKERALVDIKIDTLDSFQVPLVRPIYHETPEKRRVYIQEPSLGEAR